MRFPIFVAAALIATPALALDFSQPVLNLDGTPGMVCAEPDKTDPRKCFREEPLTIGRIVATALLTKAPDDKADIVEIAKRGDLAARIYNGKEPVGLTAEDVVLIKSRLPLTQYNAYVLAQVLKAIDPAQ